MRDLVAIASDLRAAIARVNMLRHEQNEARHAELSAIYHCFDTGQSVPQIARDFGMSKEAVGGILWRSGRTKMGRALVRKQIAAVKTGAAP